MSKSVILSPRLRKIAWILVTIFVMLIGCFLTVVGFHDLVLALRSQERGAGGIFAVAGVALIIAGLQLFHRRRGWLVTTLLMIGGLGGLTLVAIQSSFQINDRDPLWGALSALLIGIASLVTLSRDSRWRLASHQHAEATGANPKNEFRVPILAALVAAAATLLAAVISPIGGAFRTVTQPSILQVAVHDSVVGHRPDSAGQQLAIVDTEIKLKNFSSQRLVYFGSTYTVQGYESEGRSSLDQEQWPYSQELSTYTWSGQYENPSVASAIEVGYDLLRPGDYLEPGQETSLSLLTPVPSARFNSVTSRFSIATAYADRLRLSDPIEAASSQKISRDNPVESRWDILPTGWIAQLTRSPQTMSVKYFIESVDASQDPANPQAISPIITGMRGEFEVGRRTQSSLSSTQSPLSHSLERVYNFYGAAWSSGVHSVAIDGK